MPSRNCGCQSRPRSLRVAEASRLNAAPLRPQTHRRRGRYCRCQRRGFSSIKGPKWFNFAGAVEKSVARLAHETEVFAGVIFEHEREMNARLRILLDRLDDGGFPSECEVHDIGATFRMNTHAVAGFQADSADRHAF